jgi:hypothetical protein
MTSMGAVARGVAIIAIIVVVLVAIGTELLPSQATGSGPPVTSSEATGVPSSYYSSQATTGPSPPAVNGSLSAYCPVGAVNGTDFLHVVSGTASPAVFCLQFFYYNSFYGYNASSPVMVNVSDAISIQAVQVVYGDGIANSLTFDGGPNFTVSASQAQLAIGGPTNENEGAMVAYSIASNAGASGTYQLAISPSSSVDLWLLNPQEPEQCGYYGEVTAVFGNPNYAQNIGGCVTYPTSYLTSSSTRSTSFYSVQGVPYPLLLGELYFRMIPVTNSTG